MLIEREVKHRIQTSLGRASTDWRVQNSCPACCYVVSIAFLPSANSNNGSLQLEDEPMLRFSRLWAVDGNNSLKRIAKIGNRVSSDSCQFHSDYFLSPEYVNRFAHEVDAHRTQDAAESADSTEHCTDHWKAASADSKKKMWSLFDESGVFVSACRHGLILWVADMIRSGELYVLEFFYVRVSYACLSRAKYPLSMIAKALELFPPAFMIGYDIGCSFAGTIRRSSLGPTFETQQCRCGPNKFHGYTHSYLCQVTHHPNVIPGMGLEDLETLERIFSASNALASVTRYASRYRRHMLIDIFFQQWDDEKYANLGLMIYNNYRQALQIIQVEGRLFDNAMHEAGIQASQLNQWSQEEADYVASLGQEDDHDVHAVAYVELLEELRILE